MSCPHFLFSTKELADAVGLEPDIEKHGTTLLVEPLSGILMKANKRIQFNTQLRSDSRIAVANKIPEVL